MTTYDTNYSKRVLLLHCDGANASTTFTDNSSNPKTVTAYGNAQIATAQSKFGGASAVFDGTGDYLTVPASADFDFSTGDLTIEAWVYIAANSALNGDNIRYAQICSVDNGANTAYMQFMIAGDATTTGTGLYLAGVSVVVGVTTSISQSVWHHLAVSKSGTSVRFFVDGNQVGTTQTLTGGVGNSSVSLKVGGRPWSTNWPHVLNGYIDDLRITKGLAEYTANFTPPAEAFPDSAPPAPNPPPLLNISQQACVNAGFIYAAGL